MKPLQSPEKPQISRRNFLHAAGGAAAGVSLRSSQLFAAAGQSAGRPKEPATVRGAFIYPPTESLKDVGYYSWPGSGFGA
ncbi:MAG: twin-arginine translocation signal domain-containing protein [Planctomycetota bacterium]|jgi:hypothetical protein